MGVKNGQTFRVRDQHNLREIIEAFRDDVYGAQPEHSVPQIAAGLNRGSDDPYEVSEDTLRKCLEGLRKFPLHKIGRLTEITGRSATVRAICAQAGYLAVLAPSGENIELASVPTTVRKFSDLLDAVCESLEDGRIEPDELKRVESAARNAMSAIAALLGEIEAMARNPSSLDGGEPDPAYKF